MVFCLENEEPRLPLRSAMVHFQASEVQQLLHNKFVVILGDSIQRAVYKDLVLLLQRDSLLTAAQLKAKGELSFEQDQLVAGGQLGELHNGTQYREVRQFCSGSGHHLVRFYFLTRVYSEYLEGVLEELTYGPAPDLVIINSCLWDLSRYGRCSMESYRENLERVFVRMDQVLPDSCLLVWNMAMPLGERVTGGFLLPEMLHFLTQLQPLAGSLRRDVVEGNFYSATLAGDHCFDVLDLHFHFRHAVQHRHRDGVHWDQHAHRHLSHLLLTHVADAWGVELPKRDYPSDPWIEDWREPDHPFQGSHGQPPDFGEQLALPPPQLSPLPPPMPFPYPIPQPSPPPLFPPLPQDTPFFPGQPFPPHEFFNYNSTEDFSMSSHLGCGPGVNFVPGPLPPPVPGPIPHGQHRGPVVHRGMPRCAPNSPYHVPRMGGPCRQRLRHSDRLIHTNKLDRQPPAHSGTWPG
ncbi:PC-esterase domain-containing protein 1A isoform X1 [Leptonychotes weddellii]|uniref:PC-esterase domain-containing protein 1A isoform X1 n=1 Tax=Leptonychotes weddellii TaxID=9713 RepID=A0A7F8QNS1_LEPWE|nr:PC-esterase domain-containing protein 1A isoform X1 [Leptonychotes weddellii]XP_030882858.1 PC-esterase domain-containing protein 1A isoform X1 [Leptonychotes weddellii]